MYLLLATESNLKIFGLGVAIIAMYIWEFLLRIIRDRSSAILLLLCSLMIVISISFVVFSAVISASGEDSTLTGRTFIWAHALNLIEQAPLFGFGPSSIWGGPLGTVPEIPFVNVPHAHNTLLEITLQTGIAGSTLATYYIFILSRYSFYGVTKEKSQFRIAFIVFIMALARSIFEFSIFQGNNLTFFILVTLVTFNMYSIEHKRYFVTDKT